MKFAANVSTLFQEYPFLERFAAAREHGFNAVEMQFPYGFSTDAISKVKTSNMEIVLLNTYPGENSKFGFGSIPCEEKLFHKSLDKAMEYIFYLGIKKIHILAGLKVSRYSEDHQLGCFVDNLMSIAEKLEENDVTGLIEPICSETIENYFLNSFDKAVNILQAVNSSHLKLLLDVYHLKKIEPEFTIQDFEKYYGYAGHIQVSQVPHRLQPFHSTGTINYDEIFEFLKEKNHKDFIGLEYVAPESTAESFNWMKKYEA